MLGWAPDPMGVVAGLLGFGIIIVLGLALALVFSVANVFFRDFGKVAQTLTQFVTFSVPMIYPFSLRRGAVRRPGAVLPPEPAGRGRAAAAARASGSAPPSDPEATIAEQHARRPVPAAA